MSKIVKMNQYKTVIIPTDMLFENGERVSTENISNAVSVVYKKAGFGKDWGFCIMLDKGDGKIERLQIEQVPWVNNPFDVVDAYFILKQNHASECENMFLCIYGEIKSKKDLKFTRSAKFVGKCRQ